MSFKKKIVAVGMSGGVDSSVAAALLQREGYEVIGLSMRIYDENVKIDIAGKNACYGPGKEKDLASAKAVCESLGMPFYVVDLRKEFTGHVIDYFRTEYLEGRTPNPCIVCNRILKFGFMLEKAREAGIEFDRFATGHYARIVEEKGKYLLKKPVDTSKDQTYFLYSLSQAQLGSIIFPLGNYNKPDVRDIARSMGLHTSNRPESQDFISGGDCTPFFKKEEIKEGDIINREGTIIGKHKGIIYYTVGQRKGLGIAAPNPLYVSGIDAEKNLIIVDEQSEIMAKGLMAKDINLISMDRLDKPVRVNVKIRVQHKPAPALLSDIGDGRMKVIFDEPQLAITPGQSAVFYDGDVVLGGGIIDRAV
ncbi:MAG: tRNA 2-thiouridine(34) synthase MnmA [Deltaproteobacteria bacterium]|nr:tRNA 2-thiouridine(34) synthase MnmA [Deltaproteobacteria bacterium]